MKSYPQPNVTPENVKKGLRDSGLLLTLSMAMTQSAWAHHEAAHSTVDVTPVIALLLIMFSVLFATVSLVFDRSNGSGPDGKRTRVPFSDYNSALVPQRDRNR